MPIGGVVAYDGAISPSGVGFDIACGNKAVLTKVLASDLGGVGSPGPLTLGASGPAPSPDEASAETSRDVAWSHPSRGITGDLGGPLPEGQTLARIMEEIERAVAFGLGRSNDNPFDHPLFETHAATLAELDRLADTRYGVLSSKARAQLGTVGSGNHYVDLLADERDRVWVANHFGSRGLGHTIATGFLNLAADLPFGNRGIEKEEPTVISTDSYLGQFYLDAPTLARSGARRQGQAGSGRSRPL